MSARADSGSSPFDTAKLIIAVAVFLAGVFGFYYFEEAYEQLYRVLALVGVTAVSVAIAVTTATGQAAWGFAKESRTELRKVVWPTKQESLQTTAIVLVMVLLVAVILWLLDMVFLWGVEALISPGV